MSTQFVPFDSLRDRVSEMLNTWTTTSMTDGRLYLVRDLLGKVRISVSDAVEDDDSWRAALQRLAASMQSELGAHGYPAEDAVLFVDAGMLEDLDNVAREIWRGRSGSACRSSPR